MHNPDEHVAELVFGRWRSQILYSGVKLGMFEALGDETKSVETVAKDLELDPSLSYRLLRALASLRLMTEKPDRRFSLTPAGEHLLADHPSSFRGMALLEEGPEHYAIWKHLPAMVRDGKQNAFVREFDRMAFEHANEDPEYGEVFNDAMSSYSKTQAAWVLEALEGFDLSSIHAACDIAGGHGYLLCSLLSRHPHLAGIVLERPEVIANQERLAAHEMGVAERCRYIGGSMFESVPQADLYMMKLILHDWNDEECVQILRNAHAAASENAHLFVIEHIVPGPEEPHFAKLFDVHMMCWGTGRERTSDEYASLFEKAGWRYEETLPAGLMGIVRGVKT